ncbi:MAG: Asp-tRNA(Asn)/Glu-tRNA(Gln) amidotransferase subunit GatA [Phycisphaera sp.]|nr:MAG: Asp-tRNA(Asn)/Glu-tRNA(Gln) amidotransferase subunit GatA [Phycisphaera sp.]
MNPESQSIPSIRSALTSGETTAEALTRETLDRIEANDCNINAFISLCADRALDRARQIDKRIAAGEPPEAIGPLAGVPVALKDNICTDFGATTCASKYLEQFESPYSATATQRLEEAGAVIVGKANLDEFAMGSTGEFSASTPTHNPWDTSRVPGGSSSGSAAAVSAGFVPVALGSDTGGSVRLPASMCGIVGFKPTYGRISRSGLVAYASSLDQIGTLSRSVADTAAVYQSIAGPDTNDSTCIDLPTGDVLADLDKPLEGLKIAVPDQARSDVIDPATRLVFGMSCKVLADMGAELIDVDLAHAELAIAAYYTIATAEASSNLARYDGVRYGYRAQFADTDNLETLYTKSRTEALGPEVQRRIMLGTHVLRAGYADELYINAQRVRRLVKSDYDAIFKVIGAHAVATPTALGPAWRIGEKQDDPTEVYQQDIMTVGANLAGLPAISVPAGFVPAGDHSLPVGIQFVGDALSESVLLRVAHQFEQNAGMSGRVAPITG